MNIEENKHYMPAWYNTCQNAPFGRHFEGAKPGYTTWKYITKCENYNCNRLDVHIAEVKTEELNRALNDPAGRKLASITKICTYCGLTHPGIRLNREQLQYYLAQPQIYPESNQE